MPVAGSLDADNLGSLDSWGRKGRRSDRLHVVADPVVVAVQEVPHELAAVHRELALVKLQLWVAVVPGQLLVRPAADAEWVAVGRPAVELVAAAEQVLLLLLVTFLRSAPRAVAPAASSQPFQAALNCYRLSCLPTWRSARPPASVPEPKFAQYWSWWCCCCCCHQSTQPCYRSFRLAAVKWPPVEPAAA